MTPPNRRSIAISIGAWLAFSLIGPASVTAQDAAASATAAPGPSAVPATAECVEPEASAPPAPPEALSMPETFRLELFEGVWQGIRDLYVDPAINGLDWEAIGDEYAPLMLQTENAYEIYEVLGEMVGLLDDPYTNFYAPEDLGDPETFDPSYGGIGALLDTSTAGEQSDGLRILYVFEGGSARESGIEPRDRIVAVNGEACARIVDIRGPVGSDVTLTVISPGEAPRDVVLERRQISPVILPEARRLDADPTVGYLRLVSLVGQEAIDGVEQALTRFVRGDDAISSLIIDLRASNEGAPGVIIEVLRPFVSGNVGEFHSRVGNEAIEVEPSDLAAAYAGMPIIVLIDEGSEAEAEQLAAILQDQGRAIVIGEQTAGQTHGANNIDFPDGSLLQIVSFGFQLPDGQNLEGQGVTPDVPVEGDWLDFPESDDPGLVAALEVITDELAAAAEASPGAEASPSAEATASPGETTAASEAPAAG